MAASPDLPEHVRENRRYWNDMARHWVAAGERAWASAEPYWGIWGIPNAELELLPADMTGLRAIELGCGTGYVSGWMARRGATVTGIDNSDEQLATARRLALEHGAALTLIHGDAERVPLPDASFDFAISEYGAATWCDPDRWIPEAFRLLEPGGRLVFLGNHPVTWMCTPSDGGPVTERLERPYFAMRRHDWRQAEIDPGGIEFNLTLSAWFALFRRVGFTVEGLFEPRPAEGGDEVRFFATGDWARRYPSELVWALRRPG